MKVILLFVFALGHWWEITPPEPFTTMQACEREGERIVADFTEVTEHLCLPQPHEYAQNDDH